MIIANRFRLTPDNPPNNGIMFVNHEPEGRSGHLGHALVEYAPGKLLAFYPNCSAEDERYKGHSGFGWMEYKRSTDGGKTWSDPMVEPNSKKLYDMQIGRTMMCEKAVYTDEGRIVLFYLTCDMITNGHIWEPFFEPRYAFSDDGGETWSEAEILIHEAGRIFDAAYKDGVIYVLFSANGEIPGVQHFHEFVYKLFVSEDGGKSFHLKSRLPFQSTFNCIYGNMEFIDDDRMIAYIYDSGDEYNLKYIISKDRGEHWSVNRRAFFKQKIRNPQVIRWDDTWFMHGRTGSFGENQGNFVLYTSRDGIHWDDGLVLQKVVEGDGAYSNNLLIHCPDGKKRLMIQASHAYKDNRTNIDMWFLDEI